MGVSKLNSAGPSLRLRYCVIILLVAWIPQVRPQCSVGTGSAIIFNATDNVENDAVVWSAELDGEVESVTIGDELLSTLLNPDWEVLPGTNPPRSRVAIKAIQDNLKDEVDFRQYVSSSIELLKGLQINIKEEDVPDQRCVIRFTALNTNNRLPEFTKTTELKFEIDTSWNLDIPLNFKSADALIITDWDRDETNTTMRIQSSDATLTGLVSKRSEHTPTTPFEYDVQLFISKSLEGGTHTYTLRPHDGVNEGLTELTVTITVTTSNLHKPKFRNMDYNLDLDDMPKEGDVLDLPHLEAYDPDEEIRDGLTDLITKTRKASTFTYSIVNPNLHKYITFQDDTLGTLVFTSEVSTQLGEPPSEIELIATQDSTGDTTEPSTLTIKWPSPAPLKFPSHTHHVHVDSWPESGTEINLGIVPDPPFPRANIIYSYGDVPPAPQGKLVFGTGSQLRFTDDLDPSDLGDYEKNSIIVFDLKAEVDGDPAYAPAVVTVVITLTPDDAVTTTEPPGTTPEITCPTVPPDCPSTTPEPCDCSSTPPDCPATTPEPCDCSTTPSDCPLTTPEPCDCSSTTSDCSFTTPEPCDCSSTTSDCSVTTPEPCDCSSPTSDCPFTTPEPCDCSSTTSDCPVTTPEPCDCSSSEPPITGPPDCPSTTPEPCDCSCSTSEPTTPGNPITGETDCPVCTSTDNPSSTFPPPDCPSTTPEPCDCTTSSDDPLPCSTDNPSTDCPPPECTPEPCDCTSSPTSNTCPPTEPCDCTTHPTPCPTLPPDPCDCTPDPTTPCPTTCPPCENDDPDHDESKDDDDKCSKGGLIAGVITTSVLCLLFILLAGYLYWLLRKGQSDNISKRTLLSFSNESPPTPPIIPVNPDPIQPRFSFGEKGGMLNPYATSTAATNPTPLFPAVEPGFQNPNFATADPLVLTPLSSAAPIPAVVPLPASDPDPPTDPPKKSNIKTPKEIEPDYEEMGGGDSGEDMASKAERKQSRVLFAPTDEYRVIPEDGADAAPGPSADAEPPVDDDNEDVSERL